jgi:thiamine biosynthesis protein ThiS
MPITDPTPTTTPIDPAYTSPTRDGFPAATATAVPAGTTVADLVVRVLPNARAYAVEVNRSVLSRRDHATRAVTAGDRIEIVTLVGGG